MLQRSKYSAQRKISFATCRAVLGAVLGKEPAASDAQVFEHIIGQDDIHLTRGCDDRDEHT